jgi:hypothetical protein
VGRRRTVKIKQWFEFAREIDIDICAEDLEGLYLEDECETSNQIASLLSRAYEVFNTVDIKMVKKNHCKIIYDALLTVAEKFNLEDPNDE